MMPAAGDAHRRSARPSAISRAASSEPPQISELSLVLRSKIGLSSVPGPCAGSSPLSGATRTACRYDAHVHPFQLGVRCRLRLEELHPLQHPELAGQPHGQIETDRVQRVVPGEPVGEELRCPHHRSSRAHTGKLGDPAAARSCRKSCRPPAGHRRPQGPATSTYRSLQVGAWRRGCAEVPRVRPSGCPRERTSRPCSPARRSRTGRAPAARRWSWCSAATCGPRSPRPSSPTGRSASSAAIGLPLPDLGGAGAGGDRHRRPVRSVVLPRSSWPARSRRWNATRSTRSGSRRRVTAYWTRLAYLSDRATVDADIEAATGDLIADLDKLARRHAMATATPQPASVDPPSTAA